MSTVVVKKITKHPPAQKLAVQPVMQSVAPPTTKVQFVQPQAQIEKQYQDGTTSTTTEDVGGPIKTEGPQANVGVSMGMTIPLAPYNNFKFSVSLFIPCDVDVDTINETYTQIKGWVDERVSEINEEVQSQLTGEEGA